VQELLHQVKQADANSPLECNTDISQALERDALSPDGPSPAIGDNIHWRVMLINARRKHGLRRSLWDMLPAFGKKQAFRNSTRETLLATWAFTEWTKSL